MRRIKFARQQRPPPIHLGSGTQVRPEYVKTPYPTQSFPMSSPSSFSTVTTDERRIYYLSQGSPPLALSDEVSAFFQRWFPIEQIDVNCSCSLLTVTPQWELRLPHPLLYEGNEAKFVHAHHIYVQFPPCAPKVEQWEDIAKELRDHLLSQHDMRDAAIEFALSSEYSNISAWYPPKLDKENLIAFFEGNGSDDSDSDLGGESPEDQADSLTVPTSGQEQKTEMAIPLIEVNAPEQADSSGSRARAADNTISRDHPRLFAGRRVSLKQVHDMLHYRRTLISFDSRLYSHEAYPAFWTPDTTRALIISVLMSEEES
ncbi:hypothetical protein ONZ43_g7118 [Nemania bipapillata]|uniref:Uncharacterized protein n=1 Tax=Nemania bipapillata TaxID=110536 RepID=A0ACC2HU12_9PEZI|nr:hypothetical protein ONZ43_g7118 [Nemania bipapillata]